MTDQTTTPLTVQQLDEIDTRAKSRRSALSGWINCYSPLSEQEALENAEAVLEEDVPALLAEVRRLRDHVAELETYALGCDAEGCTTPHSSWCERAKTAAAENDGCTCPQPWKDSPQPHAGYCWLVSPPRDEIEQARKRIAELGAEHAKLVRWHGEDETAMKRMRATIERLRNEKQELGELAARRESELITRRAAMAEIQQLHTDSPMGPCPVCTDADAAAAGGDGLMPYPCPTGRLAGAQDCDPPHAHAPAAVGVESGTGQ